MKKLIVLIICISGFYSCSPKRPAVIERPVFELWNTTTLEIDKIEMNEFETVFHIDAFALPGYKIGIDKNSYIRESGKDKKLVITRVEGISAEEMTAFPESGTLSFKLIFPPLKPGITKIDYMEDVENGRKIMGIHLLPDAKIKIDPIPNDIVTISEPLPAPTYSAQPVKVSGRILGYVDGMASNKIMVYITNIITGERDAIEFIVSDDGSFSGEVTPGMPGFYSSSYGNLFLVPGQDIQIYLDLKKRTRFKSHYRTDKEPEDSFFTYLSGYFTKTELDSINFAARGMNVSEKLMKEIVNMKPDEYKQHILSIMNTQINKIRQNNYPPNVLLMAENTIKLSAFSYLMSYENMIRNANIQINDIKQEDRNNITFKSEKPDYSYYGFLKGQITDNMAYLPGFNSLIASLTNLFSLPDGKDKAAKERFAYFKEKITPILGVDKGILFDLAIVKFYGAQLGEMKFFTAADKQEIRGAFKEKPAFAEALIAENDRLVALLAANKENKTSILNETPQAAQDEMFDAIIAKYKGKVVFVDFWATWCGPCMVAMKSILPLKDEMKGKDVVFLYLTGETSPLGAFTQTYPTISGEHYRVSGEQWSYWMKTFNIMGIPTYMVYDRQGKQLSRNVGFPGVETIRKRIEQGL